MTPATPLLLCLTAMLIVPSSSSQIALHGCPEKCNDVVVPYPFGIGESCYFDSYFHVTCKPPNHTAAGDTGAFLDGVFPISEISLDGWLVVGTFIAKDCYDRNSTATTHTVTTAAATTRKFPFSTTRNRFTAVGCDTAAFLWNTWERSQSGCITVCSDDAAVADGDCGGVGCCQTSNISKELRSINVSLTSFNNLSDVVSFDPCSYAFLVDKDSYAFMRSDFRELRKVKTVRSALDWALGFDNCSQAQTTDNGGYACKKNSICYESGNGPGYRCSCSDGYQGNPYIGCDDINECDYPELYPCKGKCRNEEGSWSCVDNTVKIASISGGLGLVALIIIIVALFIYMKKRHITKCKESFFKQNGGLLLQDTQRQGSINTLKIFTSEELEKATDNFSETRVAGRGGFGTVYKGYLPDNTAVAVKKSKMVDQGQIDQFINEVMVLSQINHRNVVQFLGCCLETPVPLLVYEFVTNGTLYDHLHGDPTLPWDVRLKIASETAGVLSYLHSAHSVPIIHRDIKPQNILIGENHIAKVSDFGTSRLVPSNEMELCTMVQGTLGYLDPEYMHTSQLTEKSDVYSFGVVLVELLTGEKVVSFERPEEERSLVMYFMVCLREERLLEIVDKRVWDDQKEEEMREVAGIAQSCLRVHGEERPTMKEVAMELEGLRGLGKAKWVDEEVNEEERKELFGGVLDGFDEDSGCATSVGFSSTGDHIMMIPLGDGR